MHPFSIGVRVCALPSHIDRMRSSPSTPNYDTRSSCIRRRYGGSFIGDWCCCCSFVDRNEPQILLLAVQQTIDRSWVVASFLFFFFICLLYSGVCSLLCWAAAVHALETAWCPPKQHTDESLTATTNVFLNTFVRSMCVSEDILRGPSA